MGQCCPICFCSTFHGRSHVRYSDNLNGYRSWVSAAQLFFFSTFHGLSHERYLDNLNGYRSWVSAAKFFFPQKEHNALLNVTSKFINFNLLPFMDVFCSFWTPKKCWHLYKTLWHLYKTRLVFIQNQTLWLLYRKGLIR